MSRLELLQPRREVVPASEARGLFGLLAQRSKLFGPDRASQAFELVRRLHGLLGARGNLRSKPLEQARAAGNGLLDEGPQLVRFVLEERP